MDPQHGMRSTASGLLQSANRSPPRLRLYTIRGQPTGLHTPVSGTRLAKMPVPNCTGTGIFAGTPVPACAGKPLFEKINFTTIQKLKCHDVFTSFWGWAMVVQLPCKCGPTDEFIRRGEKKGKFIKLSNNGQIPWSKWSNTGQVPWFDPGQKPDRTGPEPVNPRRSTSTTGTCNPACKRPHCRLGAATRALALAPANSMGHRPATSPFGDARHPRCMAPCLGMHCILACHRPIGDARHPRWATSRLEYKMPHPALPMQACHLPVQACHLTVVKVTK